VGIGQPVLERNAHVLRRDLRVLDNAERGLSRDELWIEARHTAFDNVAANVAIVTARPDDDVISERRVANPAFVAVEHVRVAVTMRAGFEEVHVGAVVRLGEVESANLLEPRHGWEPALLLFI
jgi:hypothetical protein